MRKTRAFVITPFDAAGTRVQDTVRRALEGTDIEVYQLGDIVWGASLANAITDAIRASDFLVVDVTQKNPNVFYELGYAHALRKPTILITSIEATSGLPSDLAGFQYIVYEPNNMPSLFEHIQRAAKGFVPKEEDLK